MLDEVRGTDSFREMMEVVHASARVVHVMDAVCSRCMGDVDKSRPGLFLVIYFVAEDFNVALQLWGYLADWCRIETGLDNSTLLTPIGTAGYVFVNHADGTRPWSLMFHQFTKPSFSSVGANLGENPVGTMPILYALA